MIRAFGAGLLAFLVVVEYLDIKLRRVEKLNMKEEIDAAVFYSFACGLAVFLIFL